MNQICVLRFYLQPNCEKKIAGSLRADQTIADSYNLRLLDATLFESLECARNIHRVI